MDYFYTDYGNHETWVTALQGGSFCRVNRVCRFFDGATGIRPCAGSDFFRVDSQIIVNDDLILGLPIEEYLGFTPGETRISPVGIVEDENSEHGRYYYLQYKADSNGNMVPEKLMVADSSYTDEMAGDPPADAWIPPVLVPPGAELGMRVINMGGDDPAPDRTYLYYLEPTATTTIIYMIKLPDNGVAASVEPPTKVAEIDTVSRDRFYVVHMRDDIVALYIGDSDRTQGRRTTRIIHNPLLNSVLAGPGTAVTGFLPFPQSYAACMGRDGDLHMVLEPPESWRDGWGTMNSDRPGTGNESPAPIKKSTGSGWQVATFITDGQTLAELIPFRGADVLPWMGGTAADSYGDKRRAVVVPWFLGRQSAPPAKFAETFGYTPSFDTSTSYFMTASVGFFQPNTDEAAAFLQRVDKISNLRPMMGNHRSSTNWENEIDQPNNASIARRKYNLLVPGTMLIEPLDLDIAGAYTTATTIGTQAVRLDNWRLTDNDNPYGKKSSGGLPLPTPLDAHSEHNPSTDCTHGVQAGLFDENLGFIVGWFTNGDVRTFA